MIASAISNRLPGVDRLVRESSSYPNVYLLFGVWLFHAVLAVLMHSSAGLSTAHALVTLGTTLYVALTARRIANVVYVIAYVVGAEVLWRATEAAIFYETAKYTCALAALIVLIRMRSFRVPTAALVIFLAQLPAAITTLSVLGVSTQARMALSFTLSGPLALGALIALFSNLRLSRSELWRMAAVLSCPVIGLAVMTAFGIYSAENIVFGTESNKLASGGFGPNQVSATFSFAAILLMLFVSSETIQLPLRMLLVGGTGLLLVQSVMTFSRSGLYAASCAYIPAVLYLLRERAYRVQIVATLGVLATAGLILYPYLNDFTGGALQKRYSSTQMTGREELMATDMDTWLKNPVWGVGVGMSAFYHARRAASHNEITRWLVEHGAVGVMMLGAVLATALHSVLVRKGVARAIAASAMTWALLFLFSNGFRIAAPALAFALGCLRINSEESNALS